MATTWYLMMCLEQDLFKFSLTVTRYLDNTANESLFCKAAFFFKWLPLAKVSVQGYWKSIHIHFLWKNRILLKDAGEENIRKKEINKTTLMICFRKPLL